MSAELLDLESRRRRLPMALDQGISVLQAKRKVASTAPGGLYERPAASVGTLNSVNELAEYSVRTIGHLKKVVVTYHMPKAVDQQRKPAEWLEAHRDLVANYRGEWLLITPDGLILHSASYHQIRSAVREMKPADYITFYVPQIEETNFTL